MMTENFNVGRFKKKVKNHFFIKAKEQNELYLIYVFPIDVEYI